MSHGFLLPAWSTTIHYTELITAPPRDNYLARFFVTPDLKPLSRTPPAYYLARFMLSSLGLLVSRY